MKDNKVGRLGAAGADTFIVDVKFRQNATWQGTVKWGNQERNFRSTLELLKIMDSAIEMNHPEDKATEKE